MDDKLQPNPGQYHRERLARYARRLRDEIRSMDRSQKQIAMDLHLDPGQLSRILSGQEAMGVHHLEVWDREIGRGLLDYILAQREDPPSLAVPGSFGNAIAVLARQHGASLSEILFALEDQILTADESRAILPGLIKLQHVLNEIVSHVEQVAR